MKALFKRKIFHIFFFIITLIICLSLNGKTLSFWQTQSVGAISPPHSILLNQASSHYWHGEYQEAIRLWQKQLISANDKQAANLHRYLGVASQKLGNLGTALHHLNQALVFYESQNQSKQVIEIQIQQVSIYNELGQGARALKQLKFIQEWLDKHQHLKLAVIAFRESGTAYLLKNDFNESILAYEKSLILAEETQSY